MPPSSRSLSSPLISIAFTSIHSSSSSHSLSLSLSHTHTHTHSSTLQAILPLRGKILNIEKASTDKIYQNTELQSLIAAIGLGVRGVLPPSSSLSSFLFPLSSFLFPLLFPPLILIPPSFFYHSHSPSFLFYHLSRSLWCAINPACFRGRYPSILSSLHISPLILCDWSRLSPHHNVIPFFGNHFFPCPLSSLSMSSSIVIHRYLLY